MMVNSQATNNTAIETVTIDSDESDETASTADDRITNESPVDNRNPTSSVRDQTRNEKDKTPPPTNTCKLPSTSTNINYTYGPYVPIIRKENDVIIEPEGILNLYYDTNPTPMSKRLACEVSPDDFIVDAPSIVAPLLLKKKNTLPPRQVANRLDEQSAIGDQNSENASSNDRTANSSPTGHVNRTQSSLHSIDPSTNRRSVDDYIKATCVASLTSAYKNHSEQPILALKDYYKSSVGELLLGIGLSRVREAHLQDNARRLAKKARKNDGNSDAKDLELLGVVTEQLDQAKSCNKIYQSTKRIKCPRCCFRTEFAIVMNGHLEIPHLDKKDYLCNWCEYRTNQPAIILYHCLVKHGKRCRIEKPSPLHLCSYCPFEHKEKRRLKSHNLMCERMFHLNESYLGPREYGEFPAVTSKLITREDIRTFDNTLKTLRLAAYSPHQIKIPRLHESSNQPILLVPRQNGQTSSRSVGSIGLQNFDAALKRNSLQMINKDQLNDVNNITNQNNHSAQLIQIFSGRNPDQLRGGTLQYPRTQSPFMNGTSALRTASDFIMGPQNTSHIDNTVSHSADTNDLSKNEEAQLTNRSVSSTKSATPNTKGSTFVICEICDGYIKDLGQLKSHMQWIHKVKIHQKMLVSRPPLNCQKCQWRFFTDQGLERHLLGAHGLVTSNMQETVEKGCDSGRCTICGRAHANKLVAHMKEVHKLTLKPAHLTYKCTVCSATFNLYRLFENHVYSVHSDSVRSISAN